MGRAVLPHDRRLGRGCLRSLGGRQRDAPRLCRGHGGDVPTELPSDGEWRSLREWAEYGRRPCTPRPNGACPPPVDGISLALGVRPGRSTSGSSPVRRSPRSSPAGRLPSGTVQTRCGKGLLPSPQDRGLRPSTVIFSCTRISRHPAGCGEEQRMLQARSASPPRLTPSKVRLGAMTRWPRWNNVDDLREANKHPPSRR